MPWPKLPKIIVPGDPNCVHRERVSPDGLTGTCTECGQVRDYSVCLGPFDEAVPLTIKNRRAIEDWGEYDD